MPGTGNAVNPWGQQRPCDDKGPLERTGERGRATPGQGTSHSTPSATPDRHHRPPSLKKKLRFRNAWLISHGRRAGGRWGLSGEWLQMRTPERTSLESLTRGMSPQGAHGQSPGGSSSLPSEAGEKSHTGGTRALRSGLRAMRGHEKSHAWPVNIQLPELAGDPTGTGFSPQLH